MKLYLVFTYADYYPSGGWTDIRLVTLDRAKAESFVSGLKGPERDYGDSNIELVALDTDDVAAGRLREAERF